MSELYGPVEWSTRLFGLPKFAAVTAERGRTRLTDISPNRHWFVIARAVAFLAAVLLGIFPEAVIPWIQSAFGSAVTSGYRTYLPALGTVAILGNYAIPKLYRRRARATAESVTTADVPVDPDVTIDSHEVNKATVEDRRSIFAEKARLTLSTPDRDHWLVGPKSDLEDLRDRIDVREQRSDEGPERESIADDAVTVAGT